MPSDVIEGRVRLERILGHGGMSEVWLAHDLELERPVAVKLLSSAGTAPRFEHDSPATTSPPATEPGTTTTPPTTETTPPTTEPGTTTTAAPVTTTTAAPVTTTP